MDKWDKDEKELTSPEISREEIDMEKDMDMQIEDGTGGFKLLNDPAGMTKFIPRYQV